MPSLRPAGPSVSRVCLVVVISVLLMGCSTPKQQWSAPTDPMERTTAAHLAPTKQEELNTHTHAHLDIFLNSERVVVPAGIGIDTDATGVEENPSSYFPGKQYRVTVCDTPCISPLHTHDASGTLHTESGSPTAVVFTLGQFFTEWGVRLDAACVGEFCTDAIDVAVYVNGEKQAGNPADIELASLSEIAIVIGTPPSAIPSSWEFQPGE